MLARRFLLPAYLITILGLVCAAPSTVFHITFVNQNSPTHPPEIVHRVTPPDIIKKFFEAPETLGALGQHMQRVEWVWWAEDNSYQHSIRNNLPVYVQVLGGPYSDGKCRTRIKSRCLATIGVTDSPKYGMITRSDGIVVFQVGDPAIVSFANRQSGTHTTQAHHLAINMVDSFLKDDTVKTKLGFIETPNIIHVDPFPSDGTDSEVHFVLYGGKHCFPQRPCFAFIKFNHESKPEPEYIGGVFTYDYQQAPGDTSSPIVTFKLPIGGGARLKQLVEAQHGPLTH